MPNSTVDPPASPKFLRCLTCNRERIASDAELLSYVGDGWPSCCGKTMALYVEALPSKRADEE